MLDSYGIPTGVLNDFDPEQIAALVKQGKGLIIGVNNLELWGADQSEEFRNLIGINHVVNITGVAYAADSGALQGFYIADSGRGRTSDKARFLTLDELDKVAHFPFGCQVIYTLNAIKPLHGLPTCGDTSIANLTMLGGRPVSEKEVIERAIKEHLCNTTDTAPNRRGGITPEQELILLKEFGFAATLQEGFDAKSVAQSIKDGKGVTLGVNSNRLWNTGSRDDIACNHCITVTGVAYAANNGEIVGFYIADSGLGRPSDASRFLTLAQMRNITDVAGANTVTTNEPIKLRGQNLDAIGNELGNILVGNRGDNVLTGGQGNDLLMGDAGNDTYLFSKGDGRDVVYDHDATKGNIDTIKFNDVNQNALRFSHTGNDLTINVTGSTDQVVIKDWYVGGASGTDNHIERIKTADGKTLYDTDVEKLVQAMASFAPATAVQTAAPGGQREKPTTLLSVTH